MLDIPFIPTYYSEEVKFRSIRPRWKTSPMLRSLETFDYVTGGERPLPNIDLKWTRESRINSLENVGHIAGGGGKVKVGSQPFLAEGKAKVDCLLDEDMLILLELQMMKILDLKLPRVEPHYGASASVGSMKRVHINLDEAIRGKRRRGKSHSDVASRVGSLQNVQFKASSIQNVPILSDNRKWNGVAKVRSKENIRHVAGGGNVKIVNKLPQWRIEGMMKTKSDYVPPVSLVEIPRYCLNWKSEAKVGSLDNVKHIPAGGGVKILDFSVHLKAESKVLTLASKKKKTKKKFKCDFPFLMA